jgi:tRNA A-37 threonylcarbamoyl transferase component Bud32
MLTQLPCLVSLFGLFGSVCGAAVSKPSLNKTVASPGTSKVPLCTMEEFKTSVKLGGGVDGTIWDAIYHKSGQRVALKENKQSAEHEVKKLIQVKELGISPAIVCHSEDFKVYAMHLIEGSTLQKYFSQSNNKGSVEDQFKAVASQLVSIGAKLHRKNIVHLDMHLKNWMVTKERKLLLIDYTRSQDLSQKKPGQGFRVETQDPLDYNKATDVENAGFILNVFYNALKFHDKTINKPGRYVIQSKDPYQEMIDRMMQKIPSKRPSFEEVLKTFF